MFYICTKFLNNRPFSILRMKRELTFTLVAIFCFLSLAKAQRHEVGIQMGMSNLVGDIGSTNYVLQKPVGNISDYGLPFYAGIMYRMNFNPYQTIRLNVGYNNIQFNDNYAKENYRRARKFSGTNSVVSADLVFEYNFLPVNEEQVSMISPYIFGGVSGFYMNTVKAHLNVNTYGTQVVYSNDKAFTLGIPFGVGLKYKFNYNWALSGEFTFRPTFSDQVDYSMLKDSDITVKSLLPTGDTAAAVQAFKDQRNVGNLNSKDWINSATIILSYSFGRPPCYCK